MTRYHATEYGMIPFTPEEEAEWDAMEAKEAEQAVVIKAAEVRAERNQKLKDSDWTQLADATLSPETIEAWAAYRQALRDVPSQAGFPMEVVWPTQP